ncbi:amidase [Ruixingdingia sedimenti]|uniref:Amidase n=1 Tax=Ruixingdingia sedimenti TaxID=3073604 RepID=A0ABU1FC95_9RHOB|nr:amidase [Xinfangfangia sp. LG-4]MDR5654526.1 amidase [Xinfangfangia sp. LG-4]
MAKPLWAMDAADLADRIRRREVSCVEAVDSVLARVAAVNAAHNALTSVEDDDARAAARAADRRLAAGDPVGALHGVPFTVKLDTDVAGRVTDLGAAALQANVAAEDAPAVAHLRHAGAIYIGKSNAPCFSMRGFTDNALYGRTLNPFDAAASAGGSSGGAAVAAALGLGPVHVATDRGGSIRLPSWANGVVGLRPTIGRVAVYNASEGGERSLTHQLTSVWGPVTRTVRDARLALRVFAEPDARDPQWTPAPLDRPVPAPLRVALFRRWGDRGADPAVAGALDQAAAALAAAGCIVEEAAPPHFDELEEMRQRMAVDDARRGRAGVQAAGDDMARKVFDTIMALSPPRTVDEALADYQRKHVIARDWSLRFADCPLMLMPVSWRHRIPQDEDLQGPDRYRAMLRDLSCLTTVATLGLPGLAVPTGLAGGLPVGVQLVARWFREDILLAAGEIIERASGFSALQTLAARGV